MSVGLGQGRGMQTGDGDGPEFPGWQNQKCRTCAEEVRPRELKEEGRRQDLLAPLRPGLCSLSLCLPPPIGAPPAHVT